MNCEVVCNGDHCVCRHCQKPLRPDELRECPRGDYPGRNPPPGSAGLSSTELAEIFGSDDSTLWGNRIAAVTSAIGFPPCAGCEERQGWVNRAHALARRYWAGGAS